MEFLETVFEIMVSAVRGVWVGALGAAAVGYIGNSMFGFPGFIIGAGVGALAGTLAGHRLGLVPVRKMTGSAQGDQVLYALGAFSLLLLFYFLFHIAVLVAVVASVAAVVLFWLSN